MTFADGGFISTANAPSCTSSFEGAVTLAPLDASTTKTAVVFSQASSFGGDFFTYQCAGF
jgi:hypothetical protein